MCFQRQKKGLSENLFFKKAGLSVAIFIHKIRKHDHVLSTVLIKSRLQERRINLPLNNFNFAPLLARVAGDWKGREREI